MWPVVLFCTCKFIHGKKSKFNYKEKIINKGLSVRDLFNVHMTLKYTLI